MGERCGGRVQWRDNGGDGGGEVVAEGTPEAVAKVAESYTGRFRAPMLGLAPPKRTKSNAPRKRARARTPA